MTKTRHEQGGDVYTIDNGGALDVLTGGKMKANGTQASAITDASVAHALNATFSDTEVETALDALGTKINAIIAALEGVGIVAS